jgi:hypothetical protein
VRLRLPYAGEELYEGKVVVDVSRRLGQGACRITRRRESGADDGNAGNGNACRRQLDGAAQGQPTHNEKRGRENGGDHHIGEERMPQLPSRYSSQFANALVIKGAVSASQVLTKAERQDLLGRIAIREQAG